MGRPTITPKYRDRVINVMKALGWSQKDLAKAMGTSPAQVNGWLKEERTISRADVSKMTLALASGAGGAQYGKESFPQIVDKDYLENVLPLDRIDAVVIEMMALAGFGPMVEPRLDRFWNGLTVDDLQTSLEGRDPTVEQKCLKIAWFEYPPLARLGSDRLPTGLYRKTCDRVAYLLGLKPDYLKVEISELSEVLASGKVQLLAPLLALPARCLSMAFTSPLPGLGVGLEVVVPVDAQETEFPQGYEISYATGGIALALLQLEFSELETQQQLGFSELETQHMLHMLPRAYLKLSDWQKVLDEPKSTQRNQPRCFVADEVTAIDAVESNPTKLALRMNDFSRKVTLPLSMAVHLEERQLLAALNKCLVLLGTGVGKEAEFFQHAYERMVESDDPVEQKVIKRIWRKHDDSEQKVIKAKRGRK